MVEQLLSPEDHEHEVGEDRGRCANCRLNEAGREMSAFETAAWNWYCETVSPFSMDAGIVAEAFRELKLKGKIKALFLQAVSSVHQTFELIRADRDQRARDNSSRS